MTAAAILDAPRSPRETARALETLGAWIEDELAGGTPAKWVALQAAVTAWYLAGAARTAAAA